MTTVTTLDPARMSLEEVRRAVGRLMTLRFQIPLIGAEEIELRDLHRRERQLLGRSAV